MDLQFCTICGTITTISTGKDNGVFRFCRKCESSNPIDDLYKEMYGNTHDKLIPHCISATSIHDNTIPRTTKIKCKKSECHGRVLYFDLNEDRVMGFMCEECFTVGKYDIYDSKDAIVE